MVVTDWPALAVFVGLVLSVSLYGLTASGHFPSEHRGETLRSAGGAAVLWLTMLVCVVAVVYAVAFASRTLPWYVAVIGGGGALLVAPLLLQPLPDAFVNGRRGLVTFALAASVAAGLAWRLGG
ncbi:MAG: hypothetical protein HC868_05685 [Sphingomonadales bacterium]|nr:hypothetical protein [Sphingomonadales bacterium]